MNKTLQRPRRWLGAALLGLAPLALPAQTPQAPPPVLGTGGPLALSLPQAIRYAVQTKSSLLATRLAEQTAAARVGEIRAQGLPQVNVAANLADNFKLQKSLFDAGAFGGAGTLNGTTLTQRDIAAAQAGQAVTLTPAYAAPVAVPPQAISFGLQYAGNTSANFSQQLFDGSYLIGLKAAKVYQELSKKQTQQAEIDVVEQVSKAYYSTLVARSRLALLARNVQRLDTVLYQTNQTFKAGFAEKLDVDRLRVQRNNLVVEQQKAQRLTELSIALLKFQMGLPQAQPVVLTDSLSAAVVDAGALRQRLGAAGFGTGSGPGGLGALPAPPAGTAPGAPAPAPGLNNGQPVQAEAAFNYNNRIEFSTLQTQQALAGLDLRNRTAGAYPRLSLTAAYGFTGSANAVKDLFAFRGPDSRTAPTTPFPNGITNQNWFGFGNVGLALTVPVFDGFRRHYQVQQARIAQQTIERGFETLRQSIDLQDAQSRTTLVNALDVLDNQQDNLALAADVARVTRIKFNAGVGSNIEVITAETSLREAQTNYYAAIYDVLVAKVDRDKATGELYQQAK